MTVTHALWKWLAQLQKTPPQCKNLNFFKDCVTPDHDRRTFVCVANGIFRIQPLHVNLCCRNLGDTGVPTEITAEFCATNNFQQPTPLISQMVPVPNCPIGAARAISPDRWLFMTIFCGCTRAGGVKSAAVLILNNVMRNFHYSERPIPSLFIPKINAQDSSWSRAFDIGSSLRQLLTRY
jgi:hypothetical protein